MPIWNNKPEDDHETTVVVHDLAEEKKIGNQLFDVA